MLQAKIDIPPALVKKMKAKGFSDSKIISLYKSYILSEVGEGSFNRELGFKIWYNSKESTKIEDVIV